MPVSSHYQRKRKMCIKQGPLKNNESHPTFAGGKGISIDGGEKTRYRLETLLFSPNPKRKESNSWKLFFGRKGKKKATSLQREVGTTPPRKKREGGGGCSPPHKETKNVLRGAGKLFEGGWWVKSVKWDRGRLGVERKMAGWRRLSKESGVKEGKEKVEIGRR